MAASEVPSPTASSADPVTSDRTTPKSTDKPAPTFKLSTEPELATELHHLPVQDYPMNQYFESELTPEEKVARLRIYQGLAVVMINDALKYKEPWSVTDNSPPSCSGPGAR